MGRDIHWPTAEALVLIIWSAAEFTGIEVPLILVFVITPPAVMEESPVTGKGAGRLPAVPIQISVLAKVAAMG